MTERIAGERTASSNIAIHNRRPPYYISEERTSTMERNFTVPLQLDFKIAAHRAVVAEQEVVAVLSGVRTFAKSL